MGWVETIGEAIRYMEGHITEELTAEQVAEAVFCSPFYFQKGFSMLCGFTVSEYIRRRRLALAGEALAAGEARVIDLALTYGYDSPDSFTKAFTRFHSATPTAVRKAGATVRAFAPLQIEFSLKGGYGMEYKIVKKKAFTVIGAAKRFALDTAMAEIPQFWNQHYESGKGRTVCGMYGVCLEDAPGSNTFEYLIADDYQPPREVPEGFVTRVIPAYTWAVFPYVGPLPQTLQNTNKQIFSQWLPSCDTYEIEDGCNIEWYSPPQDYPKGTRDEHYTCEIWIPVRKK